MDESAALSDLQQIVSSSVRLDGDVVIVFHKKRMSSDGLYSSVPTAEESLNEAESPPTPRPLAFS